MKKIIALMLALAMLVCVFASCKNGGEGENTPSESVSPKEIAMKTENFSVNLAEATYVFTRYYIDFYNENYNMMSYYGIDTSGAVSLKDQYYTESDKTTWFDYFLNDAKAYMHEILIFCEASKAAGNTLEKDDIAEIDEIIKEFETNAKGDGMTTNEYVKKMYGEDVTIDDIRSFMEKEKLAFKLYNSMIDGYTFTADEQDKYLSENPDMFYYVNYVSYTFDEDDDRDAMYNARELKATADADAFYAYIDNYETEVLSLSEDMKKGASETKYYEKQDDELGKWAFSAKVGDKFVKEDAAKGLYTVYMLTGEPALQDYTTRDIRYLCLTKATYQTNEKTKAKAQDILDKWEESEKTPEAFGELCKKYSEDESTKEAGGVCLYVDKSNSILSDEGITWLFEEAAEGDVKLFKGNEIYYILYYEKEGEVQWRAVANDAMANDAYAKDMEKIEADHSVTSIKDVLNAIKK